MNSSWKCLLYKVSSLYNCQFYFSFIAQFQNALSETEGFHAYQPEKPRGLLQEAQPASVVFHQTGQTCGQNCSVKLRALTSESGAAIDQDID